MKLRLLPSKELKALLLVGMLVLSLCVTVCADTTAAPTETAKSEVTGEIGLSLNILDGDTDSAKFQEYRDIPNGLYLDSLGLRMESKDGARRYNLLANHLSLKDSRVTLQVNEFGKYSAELTYDRTPHLFALNGKTIFSNPSRNIFVLPDQVQTDLQTIAATDIDPNTEGTQIDVAAFGDIINDLKRPVSLRVDRRKLGVKSTFTPSPNLSLYTAYTDEKRSGHKAISMAFLRGNQVELAAPVNDDTKDLVLGAEYATPRGVARLEFNHNTYRNDIDALIWDNPIRDSDAEDDGGESAPERGRIGMPPDNTAQNLTFSGAYRFADRARLTGAFARGQWQQDEDFVPMTINSVLSSAYPDFAALPANSLDGKIDTSLDQAAFNFDASKALQLTARYRRYQLDNKTPQLEFDGIIISDVEVSEGPFENEPPGYTQKNVGLDLLWKPSRVISLKVTSEREDWDRVHRDAKQTRENILRASLDYQATDSLLVRLGTVQGRRRIHGAYETGAEFSLLRRFDEADRDKNDTTVMLQFTPESKFDASLVLRNLNNNYPESDFGLLRENMQDISFDWSYQADRRTDLYGGLSFNQSGLDQQSRYRQANPADDWYSRQRDESQALWLGVSHVLRPDKLTLDFSLDYNIDKSSTKAKGAPGGNASGNPTNWPTDRFRHLTPELTVNYQARASQVWRFSYRYDSFNERDFQYDMMRPYLGDLDPANSTSVYLGARAPSFLAHVFTLELKQRF